MRPAFPWGRVLGRLRYDFDGVILEVVKYHPWVYPLDGGRQVIDEAETLYHCDALRQSASSLSVLLVAWLAQTHLGTNQGALVAGVCRALGITEVTS